MSQDSYSSDVEFPSKTFYSSLVFEQKFAMSTTVVHDFNGNEVNEIHGLYGRKGYDEALY